MLSITPKKDDQPSSTSSFTDAEHTQRQRRLSGSGSFTVRAEDDAHVGVAKVALAQKVYGRYSKWALFGRCVCPCPCVRLGY